MDIKFILRSWMLCFSGWKVGSEKTKKQNGEMSTVATVTSLWW
jgi:hypothetical protein